MQPAPGYGGDAVDYRDKSGGARRITNVGAAPTPEIGNPRVGNRADIEQKALGRRERKHKSVFAGHFWQVANSKRQKCDSLVQEDAPNKGTSVLGGTMRSRPALPLPRTPSRARLIYAHGIFAGGGHRRVITALSGVSLLILRARLPAQRDTPMHPRVTRKGHAAMRIAHAAGSCIAG